MEPTRNEQRADTAPTKGKEPFGSLVASNTEMRRLCEEQRRREIVLSPAAMCLVADLAEQVYEPAATLRKAADRFRGMENKLRIHAMATTTLRLDVAARFRNKSSTLRPPSATSVSFHVREPNPPGREIGGFTLKRQWLYRSDGGEVAINHVHEPVFGIRLTEFAVASGASSRRLRDILMITALEQAAQLATSLVAPLVFADADDPVSHATFRHYDFVRLGEQPPQYFLPLGAILDLI